MYEESLAVYIRRKGLSIKKTLINHGGKAVGEYIYVRRGLFELEAEYSLEERNLYFLELCWADRCFLWHEGEPDRELTPLVVKRSLEILREVSQFSYAAREAYGLVASYLSRSSTISTSDLTHRQYL
ncbi:MAG: hypothetical protein ACK4M3_01255 [Pyrobaculum sp.]